VSLRELPIAFWCGCFHNWFFTCHSILIDGVHNNTTHTRVVCYRWSISGSAIMQWFELQLYLNNLWDDKKYRPVLAPICRSAENPIGKQTWARKMNKMGSTYAGRQGSGPNLTSTQVYAYLVLHDANVERLSTSWIVIITLYYNKRPWARTKNETDKWSVNKKGVVCKEDGGGLCLSPFLRSYIKEPWWLVYDVARHSQDVQAWTFPPLWESTRD